MAEAQHVNFLLEIRAALVEQRRNIVIDGRGDSVLDGLDDLVKTQGKIDAVDRAVADEGRLAGSKGKTSQK